MRCAVVQTLFCVAAGVSCKPTITTKKTQADAVINLHTALTERAHTDKMCTNQPAKEGDYTMDKLLDECEAFCHIDGKPDGIPVLMGNTAFGFTQSDMDSLCFGGEDDSIMKYDPELMSQCKQKAKSFTRIQKSAAKFIAEVSVFESAQDLFTSRMQKERETLTTKLTSDAFGQTVSEAEFKIKTVEGEIERFKEKSDTGTAGKDLQSAAHQLNETGNELYKSVESNLEQFKQYLKECNKLLMASSDQGSNSEYMLDLCAVENALCMEKGGARRAGCCCAVNPVVLDPNSKMAIDGVRDKEEFKGARAPGYGTRKLSVQEDANYDVCAQASKDARPRVKENHDKFDAEGLDKSKINSRVSQDSSKYSNWASQCGTSRRLAASASEPRQERPAVEWIESDGINTSAVTASRGLAEVTDCSIAPDHPNPDMKTDAKVVVTTQWSKANNMCSKLWDAGEMNTKMAETCAKFCGAKGIPFLVGSRNYGFNFSEINSICIPSTVKGTDAVLQYDPAHLAECEVWSSAFIEVKWATSDFDKTVKIFTATKIKLNIEISEKVKELRNRLKSPEFQEDFAEKSTSKKLDTIQDEVKKYLADEESDAKVKLNKAVEDLEAAAEELSTVIGRSMTKMINFLEGCNNLYTGKSEMDEYMLDVCGQGSADCLQSHEAKRVGCCCGINPVSLPAGSRLRIDGSAELADYGPKGGRRLARKLEDKKKDEVNICANSWEKARPEVVEIFKDVEGNAGKPLESYNAKMKQKYGADFCPVYEGGWVPLPAPSPPAAAPSPSGTGGTPSPSGTSGDNNSSDSFASSFRFRTPVGVFAAMAFWWDHSC